MRQCQHQLDHISLKEALTAELADVERLLRMRGGGEVEVPWLQHGLLAVKGRWGLFNCFTDNSCLYHSILSVIIWWSSWI